MLNLNAAALLLIFKVFLLLNVFRSVNSESLLRSNESSNVGPGPPVVDLQAPPMGFMSWERFRCQIDCKKHPKECISETLYMEMADALVDGGYAAYGYKRVHIDDCWSAGRDPVTGALMADPDRFPSGIKALSEYIHGKGLEFGIYGDAGTKTCGGYAGTLGYEEIDAATFAEWNVDYVKLDGCNINVTDMEAAYTAFGNALKKVASTKKIIYSCSWPAYITWEHGNETEVPFHIMYNQAGCNTWRNWHDIDNSWSSMKSIIMHWADNWMALQSVPPGSFNDADMLLVGDDHYGTVLPMDQARLQLGFWALISSPLLIGGDVRTISAEYREILLNGFVVSVSQDKARNQGQCLLGCKGLTTSGSSGEVQVWSKQLYGDNTMDFAFGFFNLGTSPASRISYSFPLPSKPDSISCSDLWSHQTVCSALSGTSLDKERERSSSLPANLNQQHLAVEDDDWDFELVEQDDGRLLLEMTAMKVLPTAHRLVRVSLQYPSEGKAEVQSSRVEALQHALSRV